MAGLFVDGFDSYANSGSGVALATKWISNNGTFTLTTGRFGTGRAITGSNTQMNANWKAAASSFTLHCGVKPVDLNNGALFGFMNGSTLHVGIAFGTDGSVIVYRNTTEIGRSAAGVVVATNYYSCAIEVVIHDTTGSVKVYLDSHTPILSLTNVDTRNGTPTDCNNIRVGRGGGSFEIDDLYITDSATKLSYFPRIETLYPDSDGATLNWAPSTGTAHYAVVDEAQASATDYLSASNVGDVDELGIGNLSSTPASIAEVCVVGYLQKTDANTREVALGVKSGATISDGPSFTLLSGGGRYERSIEQDPNTSAAWTAAGVNALQLRPKVTV